MPTPIALRLLNQHLAAPQLSAPEDVVKYMGAMQAQEYRMMRLAVAMRTRRPSHKAFKKAFDSGKIVRLHLMRGTWQLVEAEDYWALIDLCAPKAIAATKGWMHSNKINIPEDELFKIREIIIKTVGEKRSATKEDIINGLKENGVHLDEHRLSYHIRMSEMSGVICSGDLLPMKATYALTANKLPPRTIIDRDEALAMLTRKYFRSRQPATFEDFVWWSGLNAGECRRGIEILGNYIRKEIINGNTFYLADDCRTRGFRTAQCLLIPPYDEYLISYKSRDIVLAPTHSHHAHSNNGIFQPIITVGGVVCGNWLPYKKDCQTEYFMEGYDGDLQAEWGRYQAFWAG